MLEIIMKDFKIASIASKAIAVLSVIRNIIMISVVAIFIVQIGKFYIKENKSLSSKMGMR